MRKVLPLAVVVGLVLLSVSAYAQESQSAAPAKALANLLTERHLDAVAAKDTEEADRFVAALFFPGSQLLVISARCASPARLEALLDRRDFREVYMELGSASIVDSKVFFQDLKADGLWAGLADGVDIVYEHDAMQTIFDGDWKKHNLTERAYKERFAAADVRYARLLSELVRALK